VNRAVRTAYAQFDVEAKMLLRKARSEGAHIPCGPRCDHCCYDVAWVVDEEADELAERVRSMPAAKREQVVRGCEAWLAGMRGAGLDPDKNRPDLRTYHRAHLACPLLDREAHSCMAYAVRPLACRAHYVNATDPSPCANRANVPVIDTVEFPDSIRRAMATILQTTTRAQTARDMLLPRALGERLGVR